MTLKLALLCFFALAGIAAMANSASAANTVVVMETSAGTVEIELFDDKAPITVKNFLAYVDEKHYDGTIFHRVIGKGDYNDNDFMIQGGGFEPGMKQKKTKEQIKNEASNGLSNEKGTLAMARTNQPDTATNQFFINLGDNKFLDKSPRSDGYAVFGKVIKGMDIVEKIKLVKVKTVGGHENVPVDDIVIKSIKRK